MRGVFLFLLIVCVSMSSVVLAQEKTYKDELSQLKTINDTLKKQLDDASFEISKLKQEKNDYIADNIWVELEKARKDLQKQSNEVRMLRERLMISKDYDLNGK